MKQSEVEKECLICGKKIPIWFKEKCVECGREIELESERREREQNETK